MTSAQFRSSILQNSLDKHRLYRYAATQGHPFKNRICNHFMYFIKTEKVKQNEKREKFVSNERTKEPGNTTNETEIIYIQDRVQDVKSKFTGKDPNAGKD